MTRDTILWTLVLFFGGSILFGSLRRLTEDESTGVVVAVQGGALVLLVIGIVLVVRRRG